jgi:hypothetical protein
MDGDSLTAPPRLRKLPHRRPQYTVRMVYTEAGRGYELPLFCGCGLDPASLRVVEVFVKPGHGRDGQHVVARDAMMERLLEDIGRAISFMLRLGFTPLQLRDLLKSNQPTSNPPATAQAWPSETPVGSPLGAVVEACILAEHDMALVRESGVA